MKKYFLLLISLFICPLAALTRDSCLVKTVNYLSFQGDRHWRADAPSPELNYLIPPEYIEFLSDGREILSLRSSNKLVQKLSGMFVAAIRIVDVLLGSYPKMRGPALKVLERVGYDDSDPCFRGKNGFDWLAVDPNDPRFSDRRGGSFGGDDGLPLFNFWHNPFDDDAKAGEEPNPWLSSSDIAALWLNQLHKLQSLRHQKKRYANADTLATYNKDFRTEDHDKTYMTELRIQAFLLFSLLMLRLAYVKSFKNGAASLTSYHALHGMHHALSLYRRNRWNSFQSNYLAKAKEVVTAAAA